MSKIRLLLLDSVEIFREGLAKLLRSEPNIDVVATSSTLFEAAEAARAHKPDVVLIDIESSGGHNTELMQRILEIVPGTRIIVLTHSTAGSDFFSAIQAGATGYILKGTSFENLVKTIVLAAEGKLIIDPPIAVIAVEALRSLNEHKHEANSTQISLLSQQEKAILALMAHDASNRQIASALHISENTVKVHVHNIMQTLHARNRLEATVCAIEEGLQCSLDVKQM